MVDKNPLSINYQIEAARGSMEGKASYVDRDRRNDEVFFLRKPFYYINDVGRNMSLNAKLNTDGNVEKLRKQIVI